MQEGGDEPGEGHLHEHAGEGPDPEHVERHGDQQFVKKGADQEDDDGGGEAGELAMQQRFVNVPGRGWRGELDLGKSQRIREKRELVQ